MRMGESWGRLEQYCPSVRPVRASTSCAVRLFAGGPPVQEKACALMEVRYGPLSPLHPVVPSSKCCVMTISSQKGSPVTTWLLAGAASSRQRRGRLHSRAQRGGRGFVASDGPLLALQGTVRTASGSEREMQRIEGRAVIRQRSFSRRLAKRESGSASSS